MILNAPTNTCVYFSRPFLGQHVSLRSSAHRPTIIALAMISLRQDSPWLSTFDELSRPDVSSIALNHNCNCKKMISLEKFILNLFLDLKLTRDSKPAETVTSLGTEGTWEDISSILDKMAWDSRKLNLSCPLESFDGRIHIHFSFAQKRLARCTQPIWTN